MDVLKKLLYSVLLLVSVVVYSQGRHHEENSSEEERECERRTAGGDYIDMLVSHADYFNNSTVYPNNVDKCWHITAELGGHVQITFTSLHLQERVNGECVDWVSVTHGDESEIYCGVVSETRIKSTGNDITVTFHTDSSIGSSGFMAEFYAVDWSYGPHAGSPAHIAVISVIIIVIIMAVIIFSCNVLIYAMCKKYKYKKTAEPVIEAASEKPICEYPQVVLGPLPPKC